MLKITFYTLFFLSLVLLSPLAFSQKENAVWYFGDSAGVDFNKGKPVSRKDSKLRSLGSAAICTPKGRLLFYSNGYTIYDSTHIMMPNGGDIRKDPKYGYSAPSTLIVPLPGSTTVFYLFTIEQKDLYISQLYYSVIDMKLNKGKGDIIEGKRNIYLLARPCHKLAGTKHTNNKDYWILTHQMFTDSFNKKYSDAVYAWQLTASGISNKPVITHTGIRAVLEGSGQMKISPDGKKIAYGHFPYDTCVIADFDASSGKINDIWDFKVYHTFSVSFSAKSNYLYLSHGHPNKILYQFNTKETSLKQFKASRVTLDSGGYIGRYSVQLAIDNKIYLSEYYGTGEDSLRYKYLHVIHAPDSAGTACRLQKNYIYLSGRISKGLLPNFIHSYYPQINIIMKGGCIGAASIFSISGESYVDSVKWDFGDPSSGPDNTSKKMDNVPHNYKLYGDYYVKLVCYSGGRVDTVFSKITFSKPMVDYSVSDVCETDSAWFINKSASADKLSFKWKFGDGQYSVLGSPSHIYNLAGVSQTYNVTLTATTLSGCKDSVIKAVTVKASPKSEFSQTLNGSTLELNAKPGGIKYQWMFGTTDSATISSINYTFNIKSVDQYMVCLKVTNLEGCVSKTCKNLKLGFGKIEKIPGFKIYPNPNSGNFTIEINNPSKDISILIYDLLGNLIKRIEIPLNVTSYPVVMDGARGIYLVKVINGGVVYNQKVVIGNL